MTQYDGIRSPDELVAAIDLCDEADQRSDRPQRIRASAIGMECGRKLLYDVLWCSPTEKISGQLARIFRDGENVETELIAYLKKIGWEVVDRDPTNPKKQIAVEMLDGHVFGYVDAVGRDRVVNGLSMAIEIKSHNKANFDKLAKGGVEAAKPEHYAQLSIYLRAFGWTRGLYFAKCKDNAKLYPEYVEYNESYVDRLLERAEMILCKRILPPRVSANPDGYKCGRCQHKDVCHKGVQVERNCRTCEFSSPAPGGKWACSKHECEITKALAPTGCADYAIAGIFQ